MKNITDLKEAFIVKIQALYDIEKQLEKALPKLSKASSDSELADSFLNHLEETKGHSQRLERIFSSLDLEPKKLKVEGIAGIIEDGEWVTKTKTPPNIKDMMIAGAARHAEHYEMSGYMGAILEAKALGLDDAVELLTETLLEEEKADKTLEEAMEKSIKNI